MTFDVMDSNMELWVKKNRFGKRDEYVDVVIDLNIGVLDEATMPNVVKEKHKKVENEVDKPTISVQYNNEDDDFDEINF